MTAVSGSAASLSGTSNAPTLIHVNSETCQAVCSTACLSTSSAHEKESPTAASAGQCAAFFVRRRPRRPLSRNAANGNAGISQSNRSASIVFLIP